MKLSGPRHESEAMHYVRPSRGHSVHVALQNSSEPRWEDGGGGGRTTVSSRESRPAGSRRAFKSDSADPEDREQYAAINALVSESKTVRHRNSTCLR